MLQSGNCSIDDRDKSCEFFSSNNDHILKIILSHPISETAEAKAIQEQMKNFEKHAREINTAKEKQEESLKNALGKIREDYVDAIVNFKEIMVKKLKFKISNFQNGMKGECERMKLKFDDMKREIELEMKELDSCLNGMNVDVHVSMQKMKQVEKRIEEFSKQELSLSFMSTLDKAEIDLDKVDKGLNQVESSV